MGDIHLRVLFHIYCACIVATITISVEIKSYF